MFLNSHMKVNEGTVIKKLFKKRDSFSFSIVRMLHIESNIPQKKFYYPIKGEFLRIARSTLCFRDFIPKTKEFLERMEQQASKRGTTGTSLTKIILAQPQSFQHFSMPVSKAVCV